jgi:Domain of unknown function (DUF4037)
VNVAPNGGSAPECAGANVLDRAKHGAWHTRRVHDGTEGEPAPHVLWRLRAAEKVAAAYGSSPNLAVLSVAGSVGAGCADRWSDLEMDCYWLEPPSDAERKRPISTLGVTVESFWDYDEDDEEWSEDYVLDQLSVTVSNFTVATTERFIAAVVRDDDLDPVKHYRLAAICSAKALRGAPMLAAWKEQAGAYPDSLVMAVLQTALSPMRLPGWTAREALVERGDAIAVRSLVSAIAQGVFSAVLAINRTYQPHRVAKWQRQLLGSLAVVPERLQSRLLWQPRLPAALTEAETLLYDTIALAERELGIELASVRAELDERRQAVPPPASA